MNADQEEWEPEPDQDPDGENELPEFPRPALRVPAGTRNRTDVEQHLWRHSLESGVLACVATLVLSAAIPHSAIPVLLLLAGGLTVTAVTGYTALRVTGSLVMAGYLGLWGLLLTGWLALVWQIGKPWHTGTLAALFIPGIVLAVLGAPAIAHHREQIRKDEEAHKARIDVVPLRRWETLLGRLGVPAIITDVVEHPGGLQVLGRLARASDAGRPPTFAQLSATTQQIAVHKRLPEDAVYFEKAKGGSAADFVLHVRTRRGPRTDIMLPAENLPQTINRPLALGELDTKRRFELTYREIVVIVIGVRGSGKSNLLNVFIAQLARCVDAVVFMIDLKGGRAARPWMMPWVKNLARRPVIDWLATTREEANLMLDAMLAGIQSRSRRGEGGEKMTPSADLPAIILVCDETAVMTGHGIREAGLSNVKMAQKLAQVVELGRSEAMDALIAALRGNVDVMGSTAVKAMSEVRIGLRVTQASDGQMIFPDDFAAAQALARLRDRGDGLAKVGPDLSPPVHFYRINEQMIDNIALWAGDIRPEPEAALITAMGEAYEQRWTRPHGEELKKIWRESAGVPEPPDFRGEFGEIVAHLEDPEKPIDPRRKRMRELLIRRGGPGYTVGRLVTLLGNEGLTTPRETVHAWLRDDEANGLARRGGPPTYKWWWNFAGDPDDLPGMS